MNIIKGGFDKFEWVPECWAWKLTSKKGGGAIATISDTGIGLSKEDKTSEKGGVDYLNLLFFKEYDSLELDMGSKSNPAWVLFPQTRHLNSLSQYCLLFSRCNKIV